MNHPFLFHKMLVNQSARLWRFPESLVRDRIQLFKRCSTKLKDEKTEMEEEANMAEMEED